MNWYLFVTALILAFGACWIAVIGKIIKLDTGYRSIGTSIITAIFACAAIVAAVGAVV